MINQVKFQISINRLQQSKYRDFNLPRTKYYIFCIIYYIIRVSSCSRTTQGFGIDLKGFIIF